MVSKVKKQKQKQKKNAFCVVELAISVDPDEVAYILTYTVKLLMPFSFLFLNMKYSLEKTFFEVL